MDGTPDGDAAGKRDTSDGNQQYHCPFARPQEQPTSRDASIGSAIVSANFTSSGQRTPPAAAFFEIATLSGEAYSVHITAANDSPPQNEGQTHG